MPDYQEGKIYKIYNTITDDIYIGSTTQRLCERMRQHRCDSRSKKQGHLRIYKAFKEHGIDNFFIELIEKCPCNDKDELRKKEGEYIRLLKPSLNIRIEGRTKQEYFVDNRDSIRQKTKAYYEEHKEEKKEYDKHYRKNNQEHIFKRKQQYREANKERIATHKAEKVKCECGCMIARVNLAPHKRTKKHKKILQTME